MISPPTRCCWRRVQLACRILLPKHWKVVVRPARKCCSLLFLGDTSRLFGRCATRLMMNSFFLAKLSDDGTHPLQVALAAPLFDSEIFAELVARGADVATCPLEPPDDSALIIYRLPQLCALLDAGADPERTSDVLHMTALWEHKLIGDSEESADTSIIMELLSRGYDPEARVERGTQAEGSAATRK